MPVFIEEASIEYLTPWLCTGHFHIIWCFRKNGMHAKTGGAVHDAISNIRL